MFQSGAAGYGFGSAPLIDKTFSSAWSKPCSRTTKPVGDAPGRRQRTRRSTFRTIAFRYLKFRPPWKDVVNQCLEFAVGSSVRLRMSGACSIRCERLFWRVVVVLSFLFVCLFLLFVYPWLGVCVWVVGGWVGEWGGGLCCCRLFVHWFLLAETVRLGTGCRLISTELILTGR